MIIALVLRMSWLVPFVRSLSKKDNTFVDLTTPNAVISTINVRDTFYDHCRVFSLCSFSIILHFIQLASISLLFSTFDSKCVWTNGWPFKIHVRSATDLLYFNRMYE